MTEPDEFDQFYKDVRTRLLLLTYCLTGDLPSSRAAVRDAFVVAWHHWGKVSQVEDPEAWVRERACRRAQRRHTAKLWHREKHLDSEVKATLASLAKLPIGQRRVLLIAELTSASLDAMAREVGLPRTEAERELQLGTSTFSLHREVPTTSVRSVLEAVRAHVEEVRWPRATIIRRAGATRRRTHTVIGVAATAAALVVTGTLITDADGVRPTLAGERIASESPGPATRQPVALPEDALLADHDVDAALPGRWHTVRTHDNSEGDGTVMTCQTSRYAAPRNRPDAALVRVFDPAKPRRGATVLQAAESARNDRVARRAFEAAVGWFAGCQQDRAQLLTTHAAPGVGDEALIISLRTRHGREATIVAGVARTGRFTTTAYTRTRGSTGPRPGAVARLLAAGVNRLCALADGQACAPSAGTRAVAPVPAALAPGMLAEVDLPPATGVRKPWVGTEARRALDNAAATRCDEADFDARPMTNGMTRTFLVPEAKLPSEFGLTQSVGTLPRKKALAFVAEVRDKLARCSRKQPGTQVTRLRDVRRGPTELTVWRVRTEVSENRTIDFLMGVARNRTAVAQVGFVPAKGVSIAVVDFERLVQRALDRLGAMPAP